MLVFRNVMSNFTRESQLINLGEFNLEKGVFCTLHLECIHEMIKSSHDDEMCGDGTLGAGYLLLIEAKEWRSPDKEEKCGHWDRTDRDEIVVNKGKVLKVVKLSIYDTVKDLEEKLNHKGLSFNEIGEIITEKANAKRRQQLISKLQQELDDNCRYLGDDEWHVVSKENGWYPAQSLKEKDWIFIQGEYLRVHRETGQLEICIYIDKFSQYKQITNLIKAFLKEHPDIKLWYSWGYFDPKGFKRILKKRYPQVELR